MYCISGSIGKVVELNPQTDAFRHKSYSDICDLIAADVEFQLKEDFGEVEKVDETRDGVEYAVAFAFSSKSEDVVVDVVPYIGTEIRLIPYAPNLSIEKIRKMK